jgi:hypothetical protein
MFCIYDVMAQVKKPVSGQWLNEQVHVFWQGMTVRLTVGSQGVSISMQHMY